MFLESITVTTDTAAPPYSNKLLGLELIRFMAALAVLIYHYQHFAYVADDPTNLVKGQLPFYSILHMFYDYGFGGVQIFWCISGFIFFWKYRESISNITISSKSFFILRFSRLYPLHLITLLLIALLQLLHLQLNNYFFVYQNNDVFHFTLQLFMASEWGLEQGHSFNGPIWSISVEVLVYFFFFVILRFAGKSALINIGVLVLWAATKYFNVAHPIFDCLAFFYIGGLSAIVSQTLVNPKYRLSLNAMSWSVVCLSPLAVWTLKLYEIHHFVNGFLIMFAPALIFCASHNIRVSPSIQKVIEAAGNMTYSSYLLQVPIQIIIAISFSIATTPIPLYDSGFFTLFIAIVLLASYLTYRYFEAPVQNMIRQKLDRTYRSRSQKPSTAFSGDAVARNKPTSV